MKMRSARFVDAGGGIGDGLEIDPMMVVIWEMWYGMTEANLKVFLLLVVILSMSTSVDDAYIGLGVSNELSSY